VSPSDGGFQLELVPKDAPDFARLVYAQNCTTGTHAHTYYCVRNLQR
jgi:hypothetical protein